MSIGQPCKYCTHGKMRPIHFSWDHAVVLCDNNRCKSILYASPSECIIKRDFLHCARQSFSEFDLQNLLSDDSGASSSGVYSEGRSSLASPAQSRKSGTDEEVELLLKSSCSPLSFKDHIGSSSESSGLVTHTHISPKTHDAHSDYSRYNGFFELLGNLDLELPSQSMNTETQSESTFVGTGLDVVTTELEGWMKDFELPSVDTENSTISTGDCQQPPVEVLEVISSGGCQQLSDEVAGVESVTTKSRGLCIQSHKSAFSPVDASNEELASFISNSQNSLVSSINCHISSAERSDTSEYLDQQCDRSCFSLPLANELVKENMSALTTRFMSPTASAVSEDSGYNEEDGKVSSSELGVSEESLKVSSKTDIHSSLKNVDDTIKGTSVKHLHQSSFKKLIHSSLDWLPISGVHTLTVLPAMVTTEKNYTDSPQELLRLPSINQTTSREEICTPPPDERERISSSTEQLVGGSHIPSEPCDDYEHGTMFLENHDHSVTEEVRGIVLSEPFDSSVISQPSECIVIESSSHSTFSEQRNVSENDGSSVLTLGTSLSSGEGKKRGGQERNKNMKFRRLGGISARRSDPSDNTYVVSDSSASRKQDGGCGKVKDKKREVKRRKNEISGLTYSEGGKQSMPSKRGSLKKSCKREQHKRTGTTHKVHSRLARQHTSSSEDQASTSSSGENHSAKNDAQKLHENDDKRVFTRSQNPGWQIPEGRTSHLCKRVTNLSPRKLLMGQVNRDPWSVEEFYLEEVAIEIIVQDQREVSCHSDKANNYDVQIQELLSLTGKKHSESEISHLTAPNATSAFPSDVCGEMLLEKENRQLPLNEKSRGDYASEEQKTEKDCQEDPRVNNEQNVQDYSHAKSSGQKEHVDADKTEQVDATSDLFQKLPSGQNSTQFDVINESQGLTNMTQKDSQPLHKICSYSDVYSGASEENSLTLQINSNSFFSEEAEFIKEQLISNTCEDLSTSCLEEGGSKKVISNGQETSLSAKQSLDKPETDISSDLVIVKNSELKEETCVIDRTRRLPSSMDHNFPGKLPCRSIGRQYIDGCGSAVNIVKTSEYGSPWFETSEKGKELTEEQNLAKPVTNSPDQSSNIAAYSTDAYPSTSPEASPQYFLNPPKFGHIRSWIGHDDDTSLTGNEICSEEKIRESLSSANSCPNLKSEFSSSKYFQSLIDDMDFDETFLQCPVHEHPSETFFEHLKSSLFFGETANSSPSHIEALEVAESDCSCKDHLESNSTSKPLFQVCDQHSAGNITSAAYTQVPLVPLANSIAQVPFTSVPLNVSSSKVSSITGKENVKKALIIPNNPAVRYVLTFSGGIKSFDGSVLSSRPKLPLQSLVLEPSTVGASGEVNVRGKKPELTGESVKCVSEKEIDFSKKFTEQMLTCALDVAGTSSLGDGKNQGNLSNVGHINCNRKIEKISALPDSSQGIVDKEPGLDVLLKRKAESTSFIRNVTEIPSSLCNSDSLIQTSLCHCSARVNESCKICNLNSGNCEDKTEFTMPYKEQTECQRDSLSDSDVDVVNLPTLSFDSDDEILVTVPGTVAKDICTSQEKKKSFITSDKNYKTEKYAVDRVPVDQYSISDDSNKTEFKLNEIKESEASLVKTFNIGLKRKVDDEDEGNKKLKTHDASTEADVEESKPKYGNQSSYSSSLCGLFMCGILDNSVLHDEHCCSFLHQDFEDSPGLMIKEKNTDQAVKTYVETSKHCKSNNNKSMDDGVNDIVRSCVTKESNDNDYSFCSNARETTTHTVQDRTVFSHDTRFGSVKASPQYDSYSCLRVEKEADDLDFFQLDSSNSGFLASLIPQTENHISFPKPSQEKKDLEHCILQEFDASMEAEEKETITMEASQQKESSSNEEIMHSTSECASLINNGDDLQDKRNIVPPKLPHTPSNDAIGNKVEQFTTSCEEARLFLKSRCRDNVIFTKLGSDVVYNKSHSSSSVLELNQTLCKAFVLKSKPSTSVSSHDCNTQNKTLCSTQSFSLPPVSSHALNKVNMSTGEVYIGNHYVTGATFPYSLQKLPSFHSSENIALQPWAAASSSLEHSGTTSSHKISSNVQKQASLIDYQMPASTNLPSIVPPALVTSYGNLSSTLTQSGYTVSLSDYSTHYPVSSFARVVASMPVSTNCMKGNNSKLQEQKEKNLESSLDYDSIQESSAMLKKIKMGSKGSFYLRPTPALQSAISEMRKKENNDNKGEETSSGYLTLPDGNPIPHPIFIPSKKSEVQLIKQKKKRRRKAYNKKIKDLLEEKVRESLECSNKNEIPKIMVIYARGSFHICHIDVAAGR